MHDIKVHSATINKDTGEVHVGGCGQDRVGRDIQRTVSSHHFNLTPFFGATGQILSLDNWQVVDAGLAIERAIERVALCSHVTDKPPKFPLLYLGFPGDDTSISGDDSFVATEALQWAAHDSAVRWIKERRPDIWLGIEGYAEDWQRVKKLRSAGRSWADCERDLGTDSVSASLEAGVRDEEGFL